MVDNGVNIYAERSEAARWFPTHLAPSVGDTQRRSRVRKVILHTPVPMKKITLDNYRTDKYYLRIVRAVEVLLARGDVVAPVEVFVEMKLLSPESVNDWRRGRVPCLERVIRCNLSEASRVLRVLRLHVHDLNLRPSITVYMRHGKGAKSRLRFSKSGELPLEEAYSRHFVRVRSKRHHEEADFPERTTGPSSEQTGNSGDEMPSGTLVGEEAADSSNVGRTLQSDRCSRGQ